MLNKNLFYFLLTLALFACNQKNEKEILKPNVLLLCIDDLRPELNCFGASYIHSPNIDKLAQSGRIFTNHFVNAPSCGPSRYTLLTGCYGPAGNDALFRRSAMFDKKPDEVNQSMPQWFRENGYTTVSVGKVSHHPGGRGGADWNDSLSIEIPLAWDKHLMPVGEWQHPRGAMHGLAHGEIRGDATQMDVFQSAEGSDEIYPDGLIVREGMKQLSELAASDEPFFLAIGLLKPHLPFGAPKKYYDQYKNVEIPPINHPQKPKGKTTWHGSGEFMKYNRWGKNPNNDPDFAEEVRKHYAACVSYSDRHVGMILETLKKTGAYNNTIIVLWGEHGWHLGEHAIWGKHSLFEESLHSPLVISYQGIEKAGKSANGVVETCDIFPTLCELTGIQVPDFVNGRSLNTFLTEPETKGRDAIAYTGNAKTIRTQRYRFTLHGSGAVELYDHESDEKETLNIAEKHPEVVKKLTEQLTSRMN